MENENSETLFLQNWKFNLEDGKQDLATDFWAPGFDDSSWADVVVPHDWAVAFPFDRKWSSGTGYLPGGTGWYRTAFNVPEDWDGKQAFVCFDGIYKNSRVWCNGYYLGLRPFGYIGFRYDISHCLRKGGNSIAVKVSHEDFADSRWFTGSGMHRKAYIELCSRLWIDEKTLIVKTECNNNEAGVLVSGKIAGKRRAGKRIMLSARLEDKNGNALKTEIPCLEQDDCSFSLKIKVPEPQLWSPDAPDLYKLRLEIHEEPDGKTYAAKPLAVGIRTIRFDPDRGFFLNGKPLKMKGVCVHHDAGCLGAAVWPDVWRRRLEKLKEMGCNALRTSHNPHTSELYELCDEMGFLVMDEAFDEWEGCKNKWSRGHNVYPPVHQGYSDDFPQWHEQDLADMVIRDRNHPSVIMWSIGNEIDYPNDPYAHPMFDEMTGNNDANKPKAERIYNPDKPNMERLSAISGELVRIVKKHDNTRPVLLAAAFPELSSRLGLFDSLDIAGYNYKEHLYKDDHERFPKLPILGSENSHSAGNWKIVEDNDYIGGQFLWTGIDYLGEAHGWPVRASGAGLLDLAGNEKIAYYRRKALWTDKPFVYLVSRPHPDEAESGEVWPWKLFRSWDYAPGRQVEVICYANIDRAELFCNGKSCGIGERQKEYGYIKWLVPFERGVLKVACNGNDAGDTLESTLPPAHLQLKEWKSSSPVLQEVQGAYRIVQIEAEMLDEAGRLCTGAGTSVFVSLEGKGKFLGMENGDIADCTEYSSLRRHLYRGRLMIYILLPCDSKESVLLCAIAEGLVPAIITL